MSNTFFTADTHFNHANIIKYCGRPFNDVEAMNEALIANWNAVVGADDVVYHLGDFMFGRTDQEFDLVFNRLNGKTIFITGNHDKLAWANRHKFYGFHDSYHEVNINGQPITLCHYAMRAWNKSHHGAWHLYGHSHGTLPDSGGRSFDIGVDCHGYAPVSFEKVAKLMSERSFKPVDHHD